MPNPRVLVAIAVLSLLALPATPSGYQPDRRVFECGPVFGPETTPESLVAVFGEANVVTKRLHAGEGFYEDGTVIFADTRDEVEVFWQKPRLGGAPRTVRTRGKKGSWETPLGLRVGLDLRTIERLNRLPFRLAGFGWDGAGTVTSWEGGHLEEPPGAPCRVRARLSPYHPSDDVELQREYLRVRGDKSFSSGHPSMQLLNPKIRELYISIRGS